MNIRQKARPSQIHTYFTFFWIISTISFLGRVSNYVHKMVVLV